MLADRRTRRVAPDLVESSPTTANPNVFGTQGLERAFRRFDAVRAIRHHSDKNRAVGQVVVRKVGSVVPIPETGDEPREQAGGTTANHPLQERQEWTRSQEPGNSRRHEGRQRRARSARPILMRRFRHAAAEINLTPLVDVMLTVLVLFMITAPAALEGPDVRLPSVSSPEVPIEHTKVVVTIRSDGRVFYSNRDITSNVRNELARDPRLLRGRRLYVKGDRDASFASVSRVLSAARSVGITGMNLVVDPELLNPRSQQ